MNETIKNQYLNRMEINSRQELSKKLDEAIKAYNESRPHQSLKMLSPVQYENHLTNIQKEKRNKMTIYTIKTDPAESANTQLNLFENL